MRKHKSFTTAISRTWRSPFVLGATVLIGLLVLLWSVQQSNVSTLARRLRGLKQQIQNLPAIEHKAQLDQQINQLKQQIDTLPAAAPELLNPTIAVLKQQVSLLPTTATKSNLEQQIAKLQAQTASSATTAQKEQLNQQFANLKQQVNELSEKVSQKERLTIEKDRLTIEQDQVTLQNAVYGSLIQALVGVFFFATAYFTWRHVQTIEEEQVIERFGKSVEQLGSDSAEVRLAGIYGLERVARDSDKDYWTIMELFASLIQSKSPLQPSWTNPELEPDQAEVYEPDAFPEPHQQPSALPNDVQAVLKVIGRRDASRDPDGKRIDLERTDLSRTAFKGFCFRGVSFGQADLQRSNLRETDLREADLRAANLNSAALGLANCREALFTAATLRRAELIGAILRDADLVAADLTEADLRGVDLRGAKLKDANLQGANLKGADLRGAHDLTSEQIGAALIAENTQLPEPLRSLLSPAAEPPKTEIS